MAASNLNLGKASGGVLNVQPADGTTTTSLILPASGTVVATDVAVTDNAIARYDGTTGKVQNSGVIIDDNGNVGIGVTPSAWGSGFKALQQQNTSISSNLNEQYITSNGYYNGSNWIYNSNTGASQYLNNQGIHIWKTASSGTAGNTITWTNAMTLDANGSLLLTSGTGGLGYGTGAGGQVTQLTSKSTDVTLNKPSGRIIMNNSALAAGEAVYFKLNNILLQAFDGIVYDGLYYFVNPQNYRIETNFVSYGYVSIRVTNISNSTLYDALEFSYKIIKGATA